MLPLPLPGGSRGGPRCRSRPRCRRSAPPPERLPVPGARLPVPGARCRPGRAAHKGRGGPGARLRLRGRGAAGRGQLCPGGGAPGAPGRSRPLSRRGSRRGPGGCRHSPGPPRPVAAPEPPGPSLRLSSERYLRAQPAVGVLLRGFLRAVMLRRPHDVLEFAAGYFTDPELPARVREELEAAGPR
ncbi:RIIa domain-containing protein 1 [Anser cygnoides]|uniref:RIIa domain-containing protein 1 n=1 Tax=Anser cygnoides TaxID=8845 RepID=UPI0034D35AE1